MATPSPSTVRRLHHPLSEVFGLPAEHVPMVAKRIEWRVVSVTLARLADQRGASMDEQLSAGEQVIAELRQRVSGPRQLFRLGVNVKLSMGQPFEGLPTPSTVEV